MIDLNFCAEILNKHERFWANIYLKNKEFKNAVWDIGFNNETGNNIFIGNLYPEYCDSPMNWRNFIPSTAFEFTKLWKTKLEIDNRYAATSVALDCDLEDMDISYYELGLELKLNRT